MLDLFKIFKYKEISKFLKFISVLYNFKIQNLFKNFLLVKTIIRFIYLTNFWLNND